MFHINEQDIKIEEHNFLQDAENYIDVDMFHEENRENINEELDPLGGIGTYDELTIQHCKQEYECTSEEKSTRSRYKSRRPRTSNVSSVENMPNHSKLKKLSCCIVGCNCNNKKTPTNEQVLFIVPKDPSRREMWLKSASPYIEEGKTDLKRMYFCNLHFEKKFIVNTPTIVEKDGKSVELARKRVRLLKTAVPSLFNKQSKQTNAVENEGNNLPDEDHCHTGLSLQVENAIEAAEYSSKKSLAITNLPSSLTVENEDSNRPDEDNHRYTSSLLPQVENAITSVEYSNDKSCAFTNLPSSLTVENEDSNRPGEDNHHYTSSPLPQVESAIISAEYSDDKSCAITNLPSSLTVENEDNNRPDEDNHHYTSSLLPQVENATISAEYRDDKSRAFSSSPVSSTPYADSYEQINHSPINVKLENDTEDIMTADMVSHESGSQSGSVDSSSFSKSEYIDTEKCSSETEKQEVQQLNFTISYLFNDIRSVGVQALPPILTAGKVPIGNFFGYCGDSFAHASRSVLVKQNMTVECTSQEKSTRSSYKSRRLRTSNGSSVNNIKNKKTCCIVGCTYNNEKSPTNEQVLFLVPKDPSKRQMWLKSAGPHIKEGKIFRAKLYICSLHFEKKFIINTPTVVEIDGKSVELARKRVRLLKTAVPSLFNKQSKQTDAVESEGNNLPDEDYCRTGSSLQVENAIEAAEYSSETSHAITNIPSSLTVKNEDSNYTSSSMPQVENARTSTESSKSRALSYSPVSSTPFADSYEQINHFPINDRLDNDTEDIMTADMVTHESGSQSGSVDSSSFSKSEYIDTEKNGSESEKQGEEQRNYTISNLFNDIKSVGVQALPPLWTAGKVRMGIFYWYCGDSFAHASLSVLVKQNMTVEVHEEGHISQPNIKITCYQDLVSTLVNVSSLNLCEGIDETEKCSNVFFVSNEKHRSKRCTDCRVKRKRQYNKSYNRVVRTTLKERKNQKENTK